MKKSWWKDGGRSLETAVAIRNGFIAEKELRIKEVRNISHEYGIV